MDPFGSRTIRTNENHKSQEIKLRRQREEEDERYNISIIYTNIDSLTNKLVDLKFFLSTEYRNNPPQIIALTEVNAKSYKYPLQESELQISGYNMFSTGIGDKNCRGILIYVHNSLHANQLDLLDFKENLTVCIHFKNHSINMCTIYRSPNSDFYNDLKMHTLIDKVSNLDGQTLFIGDFNYPNINWETWTVVDMSVSAYSFIDCLRSNFLYQHVLAPTRKRGTQDPHILDLVITTDNFIEEIQHCSPIGSSDHSVLKIVCKWAYSQQLENEPKYCYNRGDYEAFNDFIMNSLQGLESSTDLEGLWIYLKNIINNGTSKFIPISGTWRHKPGWKRPVSKEIVRLIRKKHILWKRFMETREPARRREYNACRNAVKNESRRREHQEQLTIAYECKANPKRFWGYIKSKTKLVSGIGDIKYADDRGTEQVIVEDEDKANVFADYFSSVFNQEPDDKFDTLEQVEIQIDMPALHISEEMVRLKLSKLKTDKSSGPDMVHPRVLKELSTHLE